MNSEALKECLAEIPSSDIEVIGEIEEGLNEIYRVRFRGKKGVMKIHTEKKEDDFFHDYEGFAMSQILEDSARIPEVYYISESNDPSFFIMEDVAGFSGKDIIQKSNFDQKRKIVHNFGEILREIHSMHEFDNFGYLRRNGNNLKVWKQFNSWKNLIENHIERDLSALKETSFSQHIEKLEEIQDSKIGCLNREFRPVLVHDDNRFSNLIVNDGELHSVIDWATGYNGTPEFDIIRAEFLLIDHDLHRLSRKKKNILRESLYEGFGRDFRETDIRTIHRLASLVYTMRGFPVWKTNYEKTERREIKENLIDLVKKLDI